MWKNKYNKLKILYINIVEYHNTLNEIDNRHNKCLHFEIRLAKMSLMQFRA